MKLGKTQVSILSSLIQHRYWFGEGFGCGWIWSTHSETRRLLDGLAKKGLVSVTEERMSIHDPKRLFKVYRPTEAGIKESQRQASLADIKEYG